MILGHYTNWKQNSKNNTFEKWIRANSDKLAEESIDVAQLLEEVRNIKNNR